MSRFFTEHDRIRAAENNVTIEYCDDDIIIVDNITKFTSNHPKRSPYNIIMLCTQGMMHADVYNSHIEIKKDEILVIAPYTLLENTLGTPDFECKVMCLTNDIIHSFLRPHVSIWNQALYTNKSRVRKVTSSNIDLGVKFHNLLKQLKQFEDNKYKPLIMQSLVKSTLLMLCSQLEKHVETVGNEAGLQGKQTFLKFLDLLDHSACKRQSVEHYASQLFITPKYLSVICKNNSGKTAIQWIHDYVNQEVRYHLKHTDLPIKDISNRLGFPNTSFFGRYVKQQFGLTPKEVREMKD